MYADARLMFPLSQGFLPEVAPPAHYHQLLRLLPPDEELLGCFHTDIPNDEPHMGNLVHTSIVSEYDLGGGGDLFKAPEPITDESILALDPMIAAMSIMSCESGVIEETLMAAGMESIHDNSLLSDVLYECNDLLAKSAIEDSFSELSDIKIHAAQTEEVPVVENTRIVAQGPMEKSIDSVCVNSMEWMNGYTMRPNFLDFQGVDFEASFGMRRAFSDGDIQTLGNNNANCGNTRTIHSSVERLSTISDIKCEERMQKLSRYRKKKSRRNFGRKIKYACRKALADIQPRVRGRFAKTGECEIQSCTNGIGGST